MKPRPSTSGASRRSCDRCGAPVLCQKTGLPFAVVADAERYTSAEAAGLKEPNRLAWCLRENPWTGIRLAEVHHRNCGFPHVIDHRCPPGTPLTPKPEGTLW